MFSLLEREVLLLQGSTACLAGLGAFGSGSQGGCGARGEVIS